VERRKNVAKTSIADVFISQFFLKREKRTKWMPHENKEFEILLIKVN